MNNEFLRLTEELIRCPSVTPADAGCQTLIAACLTKIGFQCTPMRFGNVDNLWAIYGNQSPLFVFSGHTDVVPPGPTTDWQFPPFEPTILDGKLYGRGTTDMKGNLAAMIIGTENFIEANPHFPGSIAFLITSDEEGESIDGTEKALAALTSQGIKIDYCLVGEASSNHTTGDQIRIGRRGSLHGKLTVNGKQGHVAYPENAKNPIHQSLLALDQLAKTTWDQGNDHFPATTFQITNIHSGVGASNVIPGHLEVLFNFRFGTASTIDNLKARTEAILKSSDFIYELTWQIGAEPFLTPQQKLIPAAKKAIKKITGIDTACNTGGGTSDGRFIAKTGAEVIELGVPNASAHQINEHVSIAELEKLPAIYQEILQEIFDYSIL